MTYITFEKEFYLKSFKVQYYDHNYLIFYICDMLYFSKIMELKIMPVTQLLIVPKGPYRSIEVIEELEEFPAIFFKWLLNYYKMVNTDKKRLYNYFK